VQATGWIWPEVCVSFFLDIHAFLSFVLKSLPPTIYLVYDLNMKINNLQDHGDSPYKLSSSIFREWTWE